MLRRAGIADLNGTPVHVQVVGVSDAGRVVVEEIGSAARHVITADRFTEFPSISSAEITPDTRAAGMQLATMIEKRAAVDVLTDPHDEGDPLAETTPESKISPGGSGEAAGGAIDTTDQPGFYPWSPFMGEEISNEEAHTEHDFPGVRQVEGSVRDPDDVVDEALSQRRIARRIITAADVASRAAQQCSIVKSTNFEDRIKTVKELVDGIAESGIQLASSEYKPVSPKDFGISSEEARMIDYFVAKLRDDGPPPEWRPPVNQRLILSFLGASDMSEVETVSDSYRSFKAPLYAWALKNAILRDRYEEINWLQEFEGGEGRKIASDYVPKYESILVDINDPRTVMISGMLFLKDAKSRPIVVDVNLTAGMMQPPTIGVFAKAGDRKAASEFLERVRLRAFTDNFYRGKLLSIVGKDCGAVLEFLPMERIGWNDVILPEKIIAEIRGNTVEVLRHKDILQPRIGLKRSLLLLGHPGTGKSICAKAVATESLRMHEANCTAIWVTGKSIRWSDHIKDLYEVAKELAPTLIIYEDIDQIGGDRWGATAGARNELLAELLTSMDGAESNEGIITLASSNDVKLDLLDVALSDRPGRFDRKIAFPLPSPEHRSKMLMRFISIMGATLSDDINFLQYPERWATLIDGTDGMTGAYLKEIVASAIMNAVKRHPEQERVATKEVVLTSADLDEAMHVARDNLEYKDRVRKQASKKVGAYSSGEDTVVIFTTVGNKSKRHYKTCPIVEKARNSRGRFVVVTEEEAVGEQLEERGYPISNCACVKGMALPLWDPVYSGPYDWDPDPEAAKHAQGVDNRESDPNVQTNVDEQQDDRAIPRPPEDEQARYSVRQLAQSDYPSWCGACGESADGRGEQVDLPSGRKISLCSRHTRADLDRYHDGGSAAFLQGVDQMPDSFWERDAEIGWSGSELVDERWAGIAVVSFGMNDLLKSPKRRPKSDIERKSPDLVEPADLGTPSGRDRATNPSVHEQIGDAYQSQNQWEDPDMHLGSTRIALKPDAPLVPQPYGPDNPWGDERTMWDDLDPEEGSIVQLHAEEENEMIRGVDASFICPGLYQGGIPRGHENSNAINGAGFGMLVLAAYEYQPPAESFPGVEVVHAPFSDALEVTPELLAIASGAADRVCQHIQAGGSALVTCFEGRNRSGLICAMVLKKMGYSASDAISQVQGARTRALSNPQFRKALGGMGWAK